MDFTGRRARSLARLSAYTLLAVFLISLIAASIPLPLDDPDRAMALLGELLERSTLPLVAVLVLYLGFADDAQPALWEVELARWLRPLLRLAALVYLLVAIGVIGIARSIEATGVGRLTNQVQTSLQAIERLRQEVDQAPDPQALRQSLARDPRLIEAMTRTGLPPGQEGTLARQQALARELLDRAEANLRQASRRRRADATGNLSTQSVRLVLTALSYGLFFLLAGAIWPASVLDTRERVLDRREALAQQEHDLEDDDGDSGP